MTQIGFDIEPPLGGVVSADDHCADVSGPGAGHIIPAFMRRRIIGKTDAKIVRLADIYRVPATVRGKTAEDVYAADGIPCDAPERKVLEFVRGSAGPVPRKTRNGVD